MILEKREIRVRESRRRTRPQDAKVTADGLFAVHDTYPNQNIASWTVTHVPTGMALSVCSELRQALLLLTVWRALPLPWENKTASTITRKAHLLPRELRAWIAEATPYNCEFCSGYSSALCDFQMPDGKTCDAKMCWKHRTTVGPNLDYCPKHAGAQ